METVLADGAAVRSHDRPRFYLWMAGVFVLIAFGGFTPTYWARLATGTFHAPPILHVHGMLLFSWTLFYFVQTALVASGRTLSHKSWGMFGIALFSVMVCSIIATRVTLLKWSQKVDKEDAPESGSIWAEVLMYNKRKGRLLRGDTTKDEPEPTPDKAKAE